MSQKWMYLIGGVAIGLVFGSKLKTLPLVNKLPTA